MALKRWLMCEQQIVGTPRERDLRFAREFTIVSFSLDHEYAQSAGTILVFDYLLNRSSTYEWRADRRGLIWAHRWVIRWVSDFPKDEFQRKLGLVVRHCLDRYCIDGDIAMPCSEYTGPIEVYTGPCVCDHLGAIDTDDPMFPWHALTGGQAPKRCFTCSCGATWWERDPDWNGWVKITDPAAWQMLTAYNGEPARWIVADSLGEHHLLSTLLAEGFPEHIPDNVVYVHPIDDEDDPEIEDS